MHRRRQINRLLTRVDPLDLDRRSGLHAEDLFGQVVAAQERGEIHPNDGGAELVAEAANHRAPQEA